MLPEGFLQAYMLTCAERQTVREETITRFKQTDLVDLPFTIVYDFDAIEGRGFQEQNRSNRQVLSSYYLLETAVSQGADYILFLEDDLDFNLHLGLNLEHWSPLINRKITLASLYNPTITEVERGTNFFIADPNAIYGSQAFLISRECGRFIMDHWNEQEGLQDIKISRLAARLGEPIYYFIPSLVQHVGNQSTWGGTSHFAPDFDKNYSVIPQFTWESIPGWFDFQDIYDRVVSRITNGAIIVEVGAWKGRSTSYLANRIKSSGKQIRFVVVDSFLGDTGTGFGDIYQEFLQNMTLCGAEPYLEVNRGESTEIATKFEDYSIDFIFIDASHDFASVLSDIKAWRPKIKPDGVLAGHDYCSHDGVQRAVNCSFETDVTIHGNSWIINASRIGLS